MTIEDALHAKLSNAAVVTDHVGSRIYQGILRPNETLPAIALRFASGEPQDGASCDSDTWSAEIEVEIFGTSLRNARAIADVLSTPGFIRGWKCLDPASGPWSLTEERDDTQNPDNGESFSGGKIVQVYSVFFDK